MSSTMLRKHQQSTEKNVRSSTAEQNKAVKMTSRNTAQQKSRASSKPAVYEARAGGTMNLNDSVSSGPIGESDLKSDNKLTHVKRRSVAEERKSNSGRNATQEESKDGCLAHLDGAAAAMDTNMPSGELEDLANESANVLEFSASAGLTIKRRNFPLIDNVQSLSRLQLNLQQQEPSEPDSTIIEQTYFQIGTPVAADPSNSSAGNGVPLEQPHSEINKLKLFPQKQRANQEMKNRVTLDDVEPGMIVENLMLQLAQTRKQLHLKDKQMHQLNLYVQEVINENAQLQMRLQMQERSNQMLLRQLNQVRQSTDTANSVASSNQERQGSLALFRQQMNAGQHGYLRQPRKPSGKVNQKMTGQRSRKDESAEAEAEADLEDEEEGEEQPSEKKERSPRFNKEEEDEENNNSQDQEGQRRVINVNKMPHLQSSKNRKSPGGVKLQLKKESPPHDEMLELEDEQEEEDILPSLSSARQTHRRVNLSHSQQNNANALEKSRSHALLNYRAFQFGNNRARLQNQSSSQAVSRGSGPKNLFSMVPAPPAPQGSQTNADENVNYSEVISQSSPVIHSESREDLASMSNFGLRAQYNSQQPNSMRAKKQKLYNYVTTENRQQNDYEQQVQVQLVNSSQPPTRASQSLKNKSNQLKKENKGSSGKIKPKLDFSFDGEGKQDLLNEEEDKSDYDNEAQGESAEVGGSTLIRRAALLQQSNEVSHNMQQQINKVNEMDVKVSRFEQVRGTGRLSNPYLHQLEETIPNEAQTGRTASCDRLPPTESQSRFLVTAGNMNMTQTSSVAPGELQNTVGGDGPGAISDPPPSLQPSFLGSCNNANNNVGDASIVVRTSAADNNHRRRRRQQQISNVGGDKGNDTILDVEEEEKEDEEDASPDLEAEEEKGQDQESQPVPITLQQRRRRDNSTRAITHGSARRQALQQRQSMPIYGNEYTGRNTELLALMLSSNSFESNTIVATGQNLTSGGGIGPINNLNLNNNQSGLAGLSGLVDINNQSFSQMSQIGENLAESRDYENPINQIRISNKNFPNHSALLSNSGMDAATRSRMRPADVPPRNISLLAQISQMHQQLSLMQQQEAFVGSSSSQSEEDHRQELPHFGSRRRAGAGSLTASNAAGDDSAGPRQESENLILSEQNSIIANLAHLNQHGRHVQPAANLRQQSMRISFGQRGGHQGVSLGHGRAGEASAAGSIMNAPNASLRAGASQRSGMHRQVLGAGHPGLTGLSHSGPGQSVPFGGRGRRFERGFGPGRGGEVRPMMVQASRGQGPGGHPGSGMPSLSGQAVRGEGMMQPFDDMGLDEYDVADERQHEIGFDRWEINLDDMTYEDLLNLQERIGYVNKGLDLNRIKSFPQMRRHELQKFLKEQKRQKKEERRRAAQQTKQQLLRQLTQLQEQCESAAASSLLHSASLGSNGNEADSYHLDERWLPDHNQQLRLELLSHSRASVSPGVRVPAASVDHSALNDLLVQVPDDPSALAFNVQPDQDEDDQGSQIGVINKMQQELGGQNSRRNMHSDVKKKRRVNVQTAFKSNSIVDDRMMRTERLHMGEERKMSHRMSALSSDKLTSVNDATDQHVVPFTAQRASMSLTQQQLEHALRQGDSSLLTPPEKSRQALPAHGTGTNGGHQSTRTCNTSQVKVDDCTICFDSIQDNHLIKVLQPCNHYFHNDCINQWLIIEKRCPMCMAPLQDPAAAGGGPREPEEEAKSMDDTEAVDERERESGHSRSHFDAVDRVISVAPTHTNRASAARGAIQRR